MVKQSLHSSNVLLHNSVPQGPSTDQAVKAQQYYTARYWFWCEVQKWFFYKTYEFWECGICAGTWALLREWTKWMQQVGSSFAEQDATKVEPLEPFLDTEAVLVAHGRSWLRSCALPRVGSSGLGWWSPWPWLTSKANVLCLLGVQGEVVDVAPVFQVPHLLPIGFLVVI